MQFGIPISGYFFGGESRRKVSQWFGGLQGRIEK